jgi:hypothetical protein
MYRRATESTWPPSISNILCFKAQEGSLLVCPVAILLMELGIKVCCDHACACQRFESCDRVEREYSAFLGELMNRLRIEERRQHVRFELDQG